MARAISAFGDGENRELIMVTGSSAIVHRDSIIAIAAQKKLPAIYPQRTYVTSGGLVSYGPDNFDQYRRPAG